MKALQSPWTASVIGCVLFLATLGFTWRPPERQAAVSAEPHEARVANWALNLENTEVSLLVEELKKEKENLTRRRTELEALAERLRVERQEMNQLTQAVYRMTTQFESNVVRLEEAELPNLKKLARTYAEMTPEGAAVIFKQMDDTTIIKMLAIMKEAQTAPILQAMSMGGSDSAKRVADISEKLRMTLSTPAPTSAKKAP